MEKLRIQQEQTLGTLDTKKDAMMERPTQAIMDRLDGLLGGRSGSKNGESNSGEPSWELRVNFNEQQNRRKTYVSTRGRGSSSSYATGDNRTRGSDIRGSSTGNRQTSNERPTQDTQATGRCDSRNRGHASQRKNNPSDQDKRENPEPLSGAMILRRGIQETLHQRPQPLNLSTGLWKHFLRGYLEPMNVVKSPEGFLRKQDAIKTNLMAVLIPG